ncbi:hypothetical protein C8Q79DRAFT_929791 [Trametes meyenii]|nr:hypothetical protein C8Q79DRAFT_929791 [Trametes meyenii]
MAPSASPKEDHGEVMNDLRAELELRGYRVLMPERDMAGGQQSMPRAPVAQKTRNKEIWEGKMVLQENGAVSGEAESQGLDSYEVSDSEEAAPPENDEPLCLKGAPPSPQASGEGERLRKRPRMDLSDDGGAGAGAPPKNAALEGVASLRDAQEGLSKAHEEGSDDPCPPEVSYEPTDPELLSEAQKAVLDAVAKKMAAIMNKALGEVLGAESQLTKDDVPAILKALLPPKAKEATDSDAEYWAGDDLMQVDEVPKPAPPSAPTLRTTYMSWDKACESRWPKPASARDQNIQIALDAMPGSKIKLSLWDERRGEIESLNLLPVDPRGAPEIVTLGTDDHERHIPPLVLEDFHQHVRGTKLIITVYGHADMDDATARKVVATLEKNLQTITGVQTIDITPPAPKPANLPDEEAPFSFLVKGLFPRAVDCLVERRTWLTRDFAFFAHSAEGVLTRYVGAILGLTQDNVELAVRTVRQEFFRQPVYNSLKALAAENPRFRITDKDKAVQQIIASVSVTIRPVNDNDAAALVAHVYMNPPTLSKTLWQEWLDGLRARPFSAHHPRLRWSTRRTSCAGCHSADHFDHQCPFLHIEGWGAKVVPPIARRPQRTLEVGPAYHLVTREEVDEGNYDTASNDTPPL